MAGYKTRITDLPSTAIIIRRHRLAPQFNQAEQYATRTGIESHAGQSPHEGFHRTQIQLDVRRQQAAKTLMMMSDFTRPPF